MGAATLFLGYAVAACSGSGGSVDPGSAGSADVETSRQAIIGGFAEPERRAVVALMADGSSQVRCSGVLVSTLPARSLGFVLTAAHCVGGTTHVRLGQDVAAGSYVDFNVVSAVIHPNYVPVPDNDQIASDLALLVVNGVDASTPTMDLLPSAADALKVGTALVEVGYGATTPISVDAGLADNTERRSITRTIVGLTDQKITTNYAGGGVCRGDDGGPSILVEKGQERVAAIHWYVTGDCMQNASALRLRPFVPWLESTIATERSAALGAGGHEGSDAGSSVVDNSGPTGDASTPRVDAGATSNSSGSTTTVSSPPASSNDDSSSPPTSASGALTPAQAGCAIARSSQADTASTGGAWILGLAALFAGRRQRRLTR